MPAAAGSIRFSDRTAGWGGRKRSDPAPNVQTLDRTRPATPLYVGSMAVAKSYVSRRETFTRSTHLHSGRNVWCSERPRGGFCMSYGAHSADLFRRAGDFVDKILKGAKPAELPVEQPTKFELVINLTTAKALNLSIPESFLLRADQVIE